MPPKVFNTQNLISIKAVSTSFLLILISFFSTSNAQGNLLITPKRIVFENSIRSHELNLANTGKDSATYNISIIQIRMKADGTMENITEPDSAQLFADKYIRFFPRIVTLAPNEAQTVKVQLRTTGEMAEGEYRSHLYFRAIANEKPLGEKEIEKENSISVKLIPVFGISVPVIIRTGQTSTQLSFSDVLLETGDQPILKMTFNRVGNMSVYGDVSANYISTSGKITKIGAAKGVAVYTPNTSRSFQLQLDKNAAINYHQGKILLVFTDQSAKAVKLAEKEIILN